jgi:hypothetical protein
MAAFLLTLIIAIAVQIAWLRLADGQGNRG